ELAKLWHEPGRHDTYIGTLVNAWLARHGAAWAVREGSAYVDVGTLHGWRDAGRLLDGRASEDASRGYDPAVRVRSRPRLMPYSTSTR
ncbi:MAG: Glucose-phosphate thymidylyltransferase, partial [Deltaproteobacteria bacterium]|nr:Glucose-phosphate thymidylyltransferase [Deltaproteobacteria bacterium]